MNKESWDELKDHAKKMQEKSKELKGPAGGFIGHVWKDVQNKMWSIEQKNKKGAGDESN